MVYSSLTRLDLTYEYQPIMTRFCNTNKRIRNEIQDADGTFIPVGEKYLYKR